MILGHLPVRCCESAIVGMDYLNSPHLVLPGKARRRSLDGPDALAAIAASLFNPISSARGLINGRPPLAPPRLLRQLILIAGLAVL